MPPPGCGSLRDGAVSASSLLLAPHQGSHDKFLTDNSKTGPAFCSYPMSTRSVGAWSAGAAARLEGCPPKSAAKRAVSLSVTFLELAAKRRRGNDMSSSEDPERDAQNVPRDHPQLLLIQAYTRLFLIPERMDGSKQTTVASFGAYDVRLSELSPAAPSSRTCPLWLELCERVSGRVMDSRGCQDLDDASGVLDAFVADAMRLSGVESPGCSGG
jgi:hypothetical protein